MFVRMLLEIPPKSGQHVDPPRRHGFGRPVRLCLRQEARDDSTASSDGRSFAEKENNDFVIVAAPSLGQPGLTPGEEVVTTGSLILEQMYEDRATIEGGLLVSAPGDGHITSLDHATPVVVTIPDARR